VSTYGGILLAISPYIGIICLGIWFIIAYISKYVSLASMVSTVICAPLVLIPGLWIPGNFPIAYTYNFSSLAIIYVIVQLCSFVVVCRHSQNILRLLSKTESKVFTKKSV
jgi:glycerol-3-phosphate acyltransferase PlsY